MPLTIRPLSILFLCPQPLWPINTGARLRNFHLANALTADCTVSVLQITQPGDQVITQEAAFHQVLSAERGKSYTPLKLIQGLAGPTPVTVLNYTSANVSAVLTKTLAASPVDIVQLESIHLYRYLETVRALDSRIAVVLDWHNIESELMRRYAESTANPVKKFIAARTAHLLDKLEDKALRTLTAHLVVSEREREKLLARNPKAAVHVIPNGVDIAAFKRAAPLSAPARKTLLFVGSMDYHANSEAVLWFCRDIWPGLAAEFPAIDFKIAGRNPPPSVTALAGPRIAVTGTVEDVRPFYHEAFAVLVPLRVGGGTRLKILEAMAAGVPVISTSLGAEGLAIQNGVDILLADSAAEMATAIRSLVNQPEKTRCLTDAAHKMVRQYDWPVLGKKLENVYRTLRK